VHHPRPSAAARELGAIRDLVVASGKSPNDLAGIRNISAEAARAVDSFLERRGNTIISRYDIDGLTLAESPDVLFTRIMSTPLDDGDEAQRQTAVQQRIAAVRTRVPEQHRAEFDQLLGSAREAMDLRDENGPITLEWPFGLVRSCASRSRSPHAQTWPCPLIRPRTRTHPRRSDHGA